MALFSTDALNPGVRKREVFGWAMYDFANSGYTTVVITAVFNAYFVGVVAGGAPGHARAGQSGSPTRRQRLTRRGPGAGPPSAPARPARASRRGDAGSRRG